jgi:hypothetical protein
MLHTGQQGEYHWLVSGPEIWDLAAIVVRFHRGLRLCITAFDSGPLRLTSEELDQGWSAQRGVAISPRIEGSLAIPHDQYDEWYVLDDPKPLERDIEVFVNYGAFTLVPPAETYKTYHPTWEKSGLEWLALAQDRFWEQLQQIQPMTFVASGDNDVVVSRDNRFIESIRSAAASAQLTK